MAEHYSRLEAMLMQPDLFSVLTPACRDCRKLDPKPINPGVHYCHGFMMWRGAEERVERCPYRQAA